MDIIFIGGIAAFFLATWALVKACEKLEARQ
jgi:hypothetical protein